MNRASPRFSLSLSLSVVSHPPTVRLGQSTNSPFGHEFPLLRLLTLLHGATTSIAGEVPRTYGFDGRCLGWGGGVTRFAGTLNPLVTRTARMI